MKSFVTYSVVGLPLVQGLILPDGVGRVPALGWNSWNAFACNINETNFLTAANAIVDLGFKDAGYQYVNIDDCWSVKAGRDNTTHQIIPEPDKFPDGISGLADKIHDLGLKIGIYSSAGTQTCAGYPASIGYESIDAASFAAWGIDYLKYDNCHVPQNWTDECNACVYQIGGPGGVTVDYNNGTCTTSTSTKRQGPGPQTYCPAGYDYSKSNSAKRYAIMRDALLAQNRTIQYSMCIWGDAGVEQWGNSTGSSWRMSGDIKPNISYIFAIMNMNSFILNGEDFWGHNDADMLEVGNGLTEVEARTHFAFWAAMKSPLIMGCDFSNLTKTDIAILKNKYLLAFNQDPEYGAPAKPYKWGVNPDWTFNATNPAEYWSGESQEGTLVLMVNTLDHPRKMTAKWDEIPGLKGGKIKQVYDVWTGRWLGLFGDQYTVTVGSHDTAVLLLKEFCIGKKCW